MKRVFVLLLLAAVLLAGCAYTVETETATITVKSNGTVSDGTYQYYYYFNENDGSIVIGYPNGACRGYDPKTGEISGVRFDDPSVDQYTDAAVLGKAVSESGKEPGGGFEINVGTLLFGFALALAGVFCIAFPRIPWFLDHGWAFEYAEPSELGLNVQKISGTLTLLFGLLCIVLGLFGCDIS